MTLWERQPDAQFLNGTTTMRIQPFFDDVRELDSVAIRVERVDAAKNHRLPTGKRLFDIALALPICLLAMPMLIVLGILVRLTSKGAAIYWSIRVGKGNRIFRMPKLRSMGSSTPQVATHLLTDAARYLTPIGAILRRTSLDELPQLYSILAGDLSFVGPRPALSNQADLIDLRTGLGIHKLSPGLTGWAQVNGRDDLTVEDKVQFDAEYMRKQSFLFDLRILAMTVSKVLRHEGIRH
jgi:O-antigen biosynthesis protein WbqP